MQHSTVTIDKLASARIDAMPFSRFHAKLLLTVGSAHLFDAYDATALAFVLPVLVEQWTLKPTQVGLMLSIGYVGQLLGAVAAGALADRFGRLATLRVALAILASFSVACAFATSYLGLLMLRFLQGIGLGSEIPVAATYMNELSPARIRGRMISAIQWMFAIGTIVSAMLAPMLVPRFGWQSLFVVGGLPLILAAGLRRLLPESPIWLVTNGRMEEAAHALRSMGAAGESIHEKTSSASAKNEKSSKLAKWSLLFAEGRKRGTLAAWLIAFCASLAGYGIIGWMPTLYRTVYHIPIKQALMYGLSNGVASLVGGLLGLLLIDRIKRKTFITIGFAVCASALATLGILGNAATPLDAAVLSGIGLTFLGLVLAGIYVYAPELYPVEIKALGTGMTSAWIRIASIVGPPVIGFMLTVWPVSRVFFMFAMTAAVGAIGTALFAFETRPRR